MNRSTRIFLCGVVLSLALVQIQSQQAPGAIQTSEAAYPDGSEGLQKLLRDSVEAVRSKDTTKEAALIHALIMPEDSTWFEDEFGRPTMDLRANNPRRRAS